MAHEIEFFGSLCSTSKFSINQIEYADKDDFGEQGDTEPHNADDYACGNMTFEPKAPSSEVLSKYGIDELEYWTIANKLQDGLSFGSCGWCV